MELELYPTFYNQVNSTSTNCMKLLPSLKKNPQKIVIGDDEGVLTCFGMKRGDTQLVFKTLPSSTPINNVQLNGGPDSVLDKIFISCGAEIKAFNKKGKQFLNFDSNLAEPVRSMCVSGSHLLTAGSYVYNHYIDCVDTDYYLSSDIINSIISLPTRNPSGLVPVLACQDCALRVLKGSELLYELEVAGPPTTMAIDANSKNGDDCGILYGTQDGRLGLVKIFNDSPEYCWDMLNEHKYGSITSISCYDVTSTGLCDIILGHSDGIVQLYSLDENNQPSIQFTHAFNEGITSVCGGDVSSPGSPEIVISTSNGLVHGLTRDSSHKKKGTISSEVKAKIESLKEEISQLEERVDMSHKHYQSMTSGDDVGIMSALTQFPINDQFVLNIDEAWYTLVIETKVPLDIVILQCDVPVDLQETDNSTAVLSHTPPDIKNNNYLLATFHCNGINRLEVKVRSIEGQYGTLSVYVSPQVEPHSARLKTYSIRPLSLHQRTHSFDASLPLNQLTISGQFSLSDVHSWVRFCLPDVPDRPPDGESVVLQFKSSFTSTQLQQNEANFKSDNLSTISVIKEVISKEATKQNISIKMTHNINHDSIPHMLHLLYPKLEEQLTLAKNIQLIEALQEIKIHEGGDVSFLSPQCQLILDHATSLQEEIKRQPSMIDRLYALITDLFMDRATFKGANVKHKVPELLSLLDDCTVDILVQFFNDNN